jgi:hypothetical protein
MHLALRHTHGHRYNGIPLVLKPHWDTSHILEDEDQVRFAEIV